jgi:outer membrane biosynthesis protein TonB
MVLLETKYKKRSFGVTTAIFVLLFIWFFLYILKDDPNIPAVYETGEIAINFGTSNVGQGKVQPKEPIKTAPTPASAQTSKAAAQNITTQTTKAAPVIKSSESKSTITSNDAVKPKAVEAPKPSKSTSDALSSLINGPKSDGKAAGGDGDDNQAGDKGSLDGDSYASAYFGSGGGKSGGGWGLKGRQLSNSGKVVQNCNESGTVVVQITVNRSGNVIDARYTKGTTNTNPCLVNPAIATANKYKWQSDPKAPETQVGFIVVNFKLGE